MKKSKSALPTINTNDSHLHTLKLIGVKLVELRIRKGYNNRVDFALDFGLPHIQYWRMEKGAANITIKSLSKILNIHGLTIEEFFGEIVNQSSIVRKRPGVKKLSSRV